MARAMDRQGYAHGLARLFVILSSWLGQAHHLDVVSNGKKIHSCLSLPPAEEQNRNDITW